MEPKGKLNSPGALRVKGAVGDEMSFYHRKEAELAQFPIWVTR